MASVAPRHFEELAVGDAFTSMTRTIAEYDLYTFGGMTGDLTEFHLSTEAAKDSVFGERPAHGMLMLGIANGLYNRIGVTDGTGLALLGVEWRFRKPTLIGDTVHVVATVGEKRDVKRPDRGLVVFDMRLVNQRDETVGEGRITRLVRRRTPRASAETE